MAEREQKRRKSKQGLGEARLLYRRDLRWLVGFPYDSRCDVQSERPDGSSEIPWCVLPLDRPGRVETVTVDRDRLRRAEMGASKLRHRFPKACRKLFADPEHWFAVFDHRLEACKRVIHHGESCESLLHPLPDGSLQDIRIAQAWKNLTAKHQSLHGLLTAVQFAASMTPNPIASALLHWFQQNAPVIQKLSHLPIDSAAVDGNAEMDPFKLQLRLTCLHDVLSDSHCVENLVRLLLCEGYGAINAAAPNAEIRRLSKAVRRLIKSGDQTEETDPTVAVQTGAQSIRAALLDLIDRNVAESKKSRASLAALMVTLGEKDHVGQVERIGRCIQTEERRLMKMLQDFRQVESLTSNWRKSRFRKQLQTDAAGQTVSEQDVRYCAALDRVIKQIPEWPAQLMSAVSAWLNAATPIADACILFLDHWLSYRFNHLDDLWEPHEDARFTRALGVLSESVQRSPQRNHILQALRNRLFEYPKNQFELFDRWLAPDRCYDATDFLPLIRSLDLKSFVHWLEMLIDVGSLPTTRDVFDSLDAILISEPDERQAISLVRELTRLNPGDGPVEVEVFLSVKPFANGPSEFAELVYRVDKLGVEEEHLLSLHPLAKCYFGRRLVRSYVRNDSQSKIDKLARLQTALPDTSVFVVPQSNESADWITKYPERLKQPLSDLCCVADNPYEIAKRVLYQDFVDPEKRQREIVHLTQMMTESECSETEKQTLQNRCESLRRSIDSPAPVSETRLARLEQKLNRRTLLEYERWLRRQMVDQLHAKVAELGFDIPMQKFADDPLLDVIVSLMGLSRDFQVLGLRLIQFSVDGQPCSSLDEPENARFVAKMQGLGIDMTPWLDTERQLRVESSEKSPFTLRFTNDPIDYLLMGTHFRTCLSVGSFNFYSTVANAVDINKQVVYGRDDENRIVGRCLLTLGSRGELQRYHAYSHDRGAEFTTAVDQFVERLANDMGTMLCLNASVPVLVAKRWYNDGPVSPDGTRRESIIARHHQILAEKSQIAEPTRSDREAISMALDEFLSVHSPITLVAESLFWTGPGEFHLPAKWILEMIWYSLGRHSNPFESQLRLAGHAWRLGDAQFLDELLSTLERRSVLRVFRRSRCNVRQCFRFHGIDDVELVKELFDRLPPHLALSAMRASRKRSIRSDQAETDPERRKLLAKIYQRLGRHKLSESLRESRSEG